MQLDAGITRQKCATIAEAELAAQCAVPDVLLAYPLVGPNCDRFARLVERYPTTRFSTIADAPEPIERLSQALGSHGVAADVLIDVDVGQHRTGRRRRTSASCTCFSTSSLRLRPAGLHVYDGHNHQHDPDERVPRPGAVWSRCWSCAPLSNATAWLSRAWSSAARRPSPPTRTWTCLVWNARQERVS